MNFCRATGVIWVDVGCHSDHPFLLQCLTSLWPLLSLLHSIADDVNSSAESRALIRAAHLYKWIRDMAAAGMTIAKKFWPCCHLKQMLLTTKAANECITAAITALNLLSPGMIKPNREKIRNFSLHRRGIKNQCIVGNLKSFHNTEASCFLQMQKYVHISSKIKNLKALFLTMVATLMFSVLLLIRQCSYLWVAQPNIIIGY